MKNENEIIEIKEFKKDDDELTYDQNGGKVIGEGGYGCVFHPEINCSGEETTNMEYVTKLQKRDFSAENEIFIILVIFICIKCSLYIINIRCINKSGIHFFFFNIMNLRFII